MQCGPAGTLGFQAKAVRDRGVPDFFANRVIDRPRRDLKAVSCEKDLKKKRLAIFEESADRAVADGATLSSTGAATDFLDAFGPQGFDRGQDLDIRHIEATADDFRLKTIRRRSQHL